MKLFLSSTFLDLKPEREAVLEALRKRRMSTLAMEDFLATPTTPSDTALKNLREADLMILVLGFKAGSLLPDGSGSTYTSAEYDELIKFGKEPLVFVKQKKKKGAALASWQNDETDPDKMKALDAFKNRVGERWTWDYFTTPDRLALAVIQALDQWDARGRPGARKTFAATEEYFDGKNPVGHFQILDFSTTLLGREEQISALEEFARDDSQRVCILSGKGGIGKSKILHDWALANQGEVVFLKDEPIWHDDSDKELPITTKIVVVDDAHRQETFGKVLQLLQDTARQRNLKLIVSTRPGSATRLAQQVFQKVDPGQVLQLPELLELNTEQSRLLAEQVLGDEFFHYAAHLAEIASNSPLVIVAGGRLMASRRIDPSTLTNLDAFRSTIFIRLLEEMDLKGPRFAIDPPLPILQLIAALGPVDVDRREFQEAAQTLLGRRLDEILSTIDSLAANGIITARSKPVRVIPDVLSDYILEARCIGTANRSTRYADKLYELFGASSLKSLMRNLAELDWRRGQSIETRLDLLDGIWADIHQRFRRGDEYERSSILADLAGAAINQPDHVMVLVRTAIDYPVLISDLEEGSHYRAGQEHVLVALPNLLEATAHHPDRLKESVSTLWELARGKTDLSSTKSAQSVLSRLASWHRYGNPALNFAMLVQAARLMRRSDALDGEFTPFKLIEKILERDGEFNEWQDEMTMSIGGFGLNYAAVGPVRQSAIAYLDFALDCDGGPALHAVSIMKSLLHNFMNRMGRVTSPLEKEWQDGERHHCLSSLIQRFCQTGSTLLKAKIYDALRSATAITCPEAIRQVAKRGIAELRVEDDVSVMDAICTADHDLPLLSTEFDEMRWEQPITDLMLKGKSSLERLIEGAGNQARFTIDKTQACIEVRVGTGGFHRFMLAFAERPDFLAAMADQLIAHPQIDEMVSHLAAVLRSIRVSDPPTFRERALQALRFGAAHTIHAAANNLRVFADATEQDVALIQAYGRYSDPVAKRGAIYAITYMGKFTELRHNLKDAVLSIRTEGDKTVAVDLADAFGPYGVPLTSLTREEAAGVADEFLKVPDWEYDQGAIPRFLSRFVGLFPDEAFALLMARIEQNAQARATGAAPYRTFGLVYQDISFGGLALEKRVELGTQCMEHLVATETAAEEYGELFWDVAGFEGPSLEVILQAARSCDERCAQNLARLIEKAIPRFAFTNPGFAKDMIHSFTGQQRERMVEAFAYQARHYGGGGVFAGSPEEFMEKRSKQYAEQASSFSDDEGLEDLAKALRQGI